MDKLKLKTQLLDFAINAVETFLKEHPDLEFYAFAFDCNSEYAEVNLCFNTEDDFKLTLNNYQSGKYAKEYQSQEAINELKFNTGDWEYQCFDGINLLTEQELEMILGENSEWDDYKSWKKFLKSLNELFSETLIDFSKTETFQKIPKTAGFLAFSIDHDEDFEDAIKRLEKLKIKKNRNN